MGRKSDYQAQITKKKPTEEQIARETVKKLHKEPIKSTELAAYLSCNSRNNIHFDSKKIKGRIAEICKMSGGILTEDMFRKDQNNSRSMFYFPPESHGLLLTILDTGYFDDRKNARKLSTRETLYGDLTVNTELYLQDEDLEMVRSNPAFVAAKCESILSEAINQKMIQIIGNAMNCDETIRIQQLKRIYEVLCGVEDKNATECIHLLSSKLVYKHAFENMEGVSEVADYYKALFGADKLFDYLICLLALRMKGLNFESLNEREKMNYQTFYNKVKNEEDPLWVEIEEIDAERLLNEFEYNADENDRYQYLIQKALNVFDMTNQDEQQLFCDLIYITRLRFMADMMDERDVKTTMKFFEAASQKNAFDVLQILMKEDSVNTPIMEELRRIGRVSKHHRNK